MSAEFRATGTPAFNIESMQVTTYKPSWEGVPKEVHLVLVLSGGRRAAIRLRTRVAVEQLIADLVNHCDEAYGPDVTGLTETPAKES